MTVGYGHKLLPSDRIGQEISMEKAEQLLRHDLIRSERAVLKYIEVALRDFQFAALVSFTFNVGAAALQRSGLRQKLNYGLYSDAAKEFLRWDYAGGKKVKGLTTRRKIESMRFKRGVIPANTAESA